MDTNRIRYFLSLARTGSITKAAEFHQISAPALSKAMRVFEDEVGQKLLAPNGRGVILTDHAKALVPLLTEVVERIEAIRRPNRESSGNGSVKKSLRVATFEVFSTHFFERALGSILGGYDCSLYEMVPGKMEEAVANGVADLGITYIPIPHPDLDFIKITPIEMGIFGRYEGKTAPGYADIPFVVPVTPVEGSPNKVRGLDGWPDDAFKRVVRYRVQLLETALGLCRRGLAYAYIPKFVARLHNETVRADFALKEIRLPPKFTKQGDYAYLIKRKSDLEGREAKKAAAALRQLCREKT